MKKLMVLGMGLCIALAFTSCKSKESAYKKAYEKAKQQEQPKNEVKLENEALKNQQEINPFVKG